MIHTISYFDAHYRWGIVVIRRGVKKRSLELSKVPDILFEAKEYQRKNKRFIRRIKANGLLDKGGKPYPKSSIIRKSLPEEVRLRFNDMSGNLSLFVKSERIDILEVK